MPVDANPDDTAPDDTAPGEAAESSAADADIEDVRLPRGQWGPTADYGNEAEADADNGDGLDKSGLG